MVKNVTNRQQSATRKTPAMIRKEKELGRPLEDVMVEAWTEEGSIAKAAARLGIPSDTFFNWAHRLHIEKRTVIEVN